MIGNPISGISEALKWGGKQMGWDPEKGLLPNIYSVVARLSPSAMASEFGVNVPGVTDRNYGAGRGAQEDASTKEAGGGTLQNFLQAKSTQGANPTQEATDMKVENTQRGPNGEPIITNTQGYSYYHD
tara:strand:- start:27 stop:410 length:384 start_codon:yes stop_codon:yes gene_type:complete